MSEPSVPPSSLPLSRRPWPRRALGAGALLLLLVLVWSSTALWLPWVVKRQLESRAGAALGRRVTVQQVVFRPWSLALALQGLELAGPDGKDAQLRIKGLQVRVDPSSLWRFAPVLEQLQLQAPQVQLLRRADGSLDIDDIVTRMQAQPASADSKPPLFALHDLRLSDGAITLVDQRVGQTQKLTELQLGLPFLGNMPSQLAQPAMPKLSFRLNGVPVSSEAVSTPFAPSRKSALRLKFSELDLLPWLPYAPVLPVRLRSAALSLDLLANFEQTPDSHLSISGTAQLDHLDLASTAGQDLLRLDRLTLGLESLRPLEHAVRLSALELQGPQVFLQRDAYGALVLPGATQQSAAPSAAAQGSAWTLALHKLSLRDGQLQWQDASTRPVTHQRVNQITLEASDLAWPMRQAVAFQGGLHLDGLGSGAATLGLAGQAALDRASVQMKLDQLPLALARNYLNQWLRPELDGDLTATLQLDWSAQSNDVQVQASTLTLDQLRLHPPGASTALATVRQLAVHGLHLQTQQRRVTVEQFQVLQPKAQVARAADGQWMFQPWLRTPAATVHADPGPAPAPWTLALARLGVEGGDIDFSDQASGTRPVALALTGLNLALARLEPGSAHPAALKFSTRVRSGRTEAGTLKLKGQLVTAPLTLDAQVDAQRLPLQALAPYLESGLNLRLRRADTSYQGQVHFQQQRDGPALSLQGDLAVEEVRANQGRPGTKLNADAGNASSAGRPANELLSWKALSLHGLDVRVKPGQTPRIDLQETRIADLYARVLLDSNGRLNLENLRDTPAEPPAMAPPTASAASPASPASAPVSGAASAPAALVHVGPVHLVNGTVYFSDHFIKPNYSADLSELNGQLGAFDNAPRADGVVQMADLSISGLAEGTATVEIRGKINPLAHPLALDIHGRVRDLELAPMSTYAIKYAGYGIERGKLSMDATYVIKPDGQLSASNKLTLNQLSFGDKVEGAPASLPVKLAVALLSDSQGVIQLDLPISGSLNDPEFRIGPVIINAIGNLIGKALTAPFSLLAKALGGGSGTELQHISFAPGSARLSPAARTKLDRLAQLLRDKPNLRLTVSGTASASQEQVAVQRERLNQLLLAQKRRNLLKSAGADATGLHDLAVDPAEYPTLLQEVYRRADFAKPHNLIGMDKTVPQVDMESLLMQHLPPQPDAFAQLALRRARAVNDYLAAQQVPAERLFLGANRLDDGSADWAPQAQLSVQLHR